MGWLRFPLIIVLAIILAACSSGEATQQVSEPQNIQNDNSNSAGLVARVNGVGITQANYENALARRSINSNAANPDALAQQVLDEMVEQELINQGAPSLGIEITDTDVEQEILAQQEIAGSTEAWLQSLQQNSYTEEEWYAAQRDVLITIGVRNVLIAPYLGEIEQVNARHILVRTIEEANQVLDRLASGEGFATLASEYSLDVTTAEIGGNLGWFARNELYYSNLESVAFNLDINAMTGPVTTSLGYHVIQTLNREVRPVELERLPTLSENIFNNWLDEQYRNASIEIYQQ